MMAVAAILIFVLSWAEYRLVSGGSPFPVSTNVLIFVVINLNTLLILLLSFLIIRNLVKLIFEDKKNVLGAKLRTKLVIAFVSLSILPTGMLLLVSFQFLTTSLNYWFDTKVENSLQGALALGKEYYHDKTGRLQRLSMDVAKSLEARCIKGPGELDKLCVDGLLSPSSVQTTGASASEVRPFCTIEILDPTGGVVFARFFPPLESAPPRVSVSSLSRAFSGKGLDVLTDLLGQGELLRAISPVRGPEGKIVGFVALGDLIPRDITALLDEIRTGYDEYSKLMLVQQPIKSTLLITLLLTALLILFVSIWFGFRLAKGITEPVQMLAEATHRVAQGDLDFRLEAEGRDELSSLVRAFNTMTQDLKEARARAERASLGLKQSYAELERRRRYIEIILQNVAAGVISIDRQGTITTMNRSAEAILGRSATELIGRSYLELLNPRQAEEFEAIREELNHSPSGTVHRSIRFQLGDKTLSLVVSFTVLRDQDERSLGVVVVFDDLTELEKIQRLAAWREVARRIAHEVKNPLTPIQLSAQRLRKKYLERFEGKDQEVFDRCTNTIVSQVEELKRLVNEFSSFARMPAPRFQPVDLDALVDEVLPIYQEGRKDIKFFKVVSPDLSKAELDPDQVKRVLINLLENAVASMPDGGKIVIEIGSDPETEEVFLKVADSGPGIAPEDRPRLFEPYFSRRKGGTGLGLAIVNSIVSDHNGRIRVGDNVPHGTLFEIRFPLKQERGRKPKG